MEKDPADRYQSAGEMRNDIQRALSGAPVAASIHHTEMYNTGTRRMGQSTQLAGSTSAIPPYQYGPDTGGNRGGDYGEPPRRRAWPWVLVGAIVLLLVGGGIFAFEFASSNGGSISVPAVSGLPLAQARTEIVKANLVVGAVTTRPSVTVASGDVISSNPSDGTNVKAHSSVSLVVSAGQAKKVVPNVTNLQEQAAITALTSAGLNYNLKQVQSSQPQNTVISQSPPPGSKVAPGTIVTLQVSEGGTNVPNVIGMTQAKATQTLQSKGFVVQPVISNSAPTGTPPGVVFSMSPSPGSNAQSGATITINVAAAATTSPPTDTTSPPTDTTSPPPGGLTSPPAIP
jgi:eukaryotic-like serine/threonine-protein kinase